MRYDEELEYAWFSCKIPPGEVSFAQRRRLGAGAKLFFNKNVGGGGGYPFSSVKQLACYEMTDTDAAADGRTR